MKDNGGRILAIMGAASLLLGLVLSGDQVWTRFFKGEPIVATGHRYSIGLPSSATKALEAYRKPIGDSLKRARVRGLYDTSLTSADTSRMDSVNSVLELAEKMSEVTRIRVRNTGVSEISGLQLHIPNGIGLYEYQVPGRTISGRYVEVVDLGTLRGQGERTISLWSQGYFIEWDSAAVSSPQGRANIAWAHVIQGGGLGWIASNWFWISFLFDWLKLSLVVLGTGLVLTYLFGRLASRGDRRSEGPSPDVEPASSPAPNSSKDIHRGEGE